MKKTSKIAILAGLAFAILALGVTLFVVLGPAQEAGRRRNVLASAAYYMEKGDFGRALDLLDKLLIANATDPEASALRDKAMAAKANADTIKAQETAKAEASGQKAIAQSLDKLGQKLKPAAGTNTVPAASKTTQDPAVAAAEAAAAKARKAEEDARKKAEAEAESARKAEEAARKKAEAEADVARKKAETEELAKKGRELQDTMRAVNDLVEKGRKAIDEGGFGEGGKFFGEAKARFPGGEDRFAGQKLAEMADALYSGSQKTKGPEADAALKEAIQTAREAKKKDSTNASPFYTLGKINLDLNQTENAITELKEATRLDPKNYLYSYELGKAYFKARRYEDARQSFEATTTLNPKYERGFYNLGATWKALGDQGKALDTFRKAVQAKPNYGAALQEIGRIMFKRGDRKSAIDAYSKAIQAEPDNALAMSELAVVQADGGDYKAAEGLFLRALGVKDDAQTNYNMATVKLKLEKPADAVKYAEKSVAQSATIALYQYTLGLANEKSGNVDGAIAAYLQSTTLDAKYAEPRINLGRLYLDSGFTEKALEQLEKAYQAAPKSFEANNNLANAYAKKGLFEKSAFHYGIARDLAPRDTTVGMNLAKSFVNANRLDAARDAFRELIKIAPTEWDAYYELGKLYINAGDGAGARKILGELLSKNPGYAKKAEIERILAGL